MGEAYRIHRQNDLYFLTFTVIDWMDVFTRKEHMAIVVDSLNFCVANKGFSINAWVLMSNHLHLLGYAREGFRLSDITRDLKKFTSRSIREHIQTGIESRRHWLLDRMAFRARQVARSDEFKLWEDDSHAVLIEDVEHRTNVIDYIHNNPVKAHFVRLPEHYLHSSAIDYANGNGLVKVELV
ncbi:MAG: transposase [Flavobacteriales bacterium]|jgi:REP element-mobilizing transposase RayT|nr:transposase [Flavobacteriales bacterium]MBK9059483.1 transposase [Flavobacteriales bacterium]MBK9598149.1 transposase [Flavobacteriales bacterium]QQS73574.1 MAG: transposase [Flavobacteriales bacterium]HQV37315.1 transposase [Flavobacteriales bacterium]